MIFIVIQKLDKNAKVLMITLRVKEIQNIYSVQIGWQISKVSWSQLDINVKKLNIVVRIIMIINYKWAILYVEKEKLELTALIMEMNATKNFIMDAMIGSQKMKLFWYY